MKTNILIVVEGNRSLRAYSEDRNISVKFVTVLIMLSQQGEILVDELLQQRLRGIWQKSYTEGHLVAIHPIRDITTDDIAGRDLELAVLRTLNRIECKI